MKKRRTVQDYIAMCKEHFPLNMPVSVCIGVTSLNKERHPFMRDSGSATQGKNRWYIRINKQSARNDQIDTLMHEWAHCRVDWDDDVQHSDKWGKEYAKIRRKLIDED